MELTTHARTVETYRESFFLLTLNGGSSSIKFVLYQTGGPLKKSLYGKLTALV